MRIVVNAGLFAAAEQVDPARDAKLSALRDLIARKCQQPTNPGNRKLIVFTAFADTAIYLYENLSGWAKSTLGIEAALVTGSGRNQTTLPGMRKDLSSILTSFSPRSKERPADMAAEGELDLLIATDCISEGQNLQDCDWLVNYDIHWNPCASSSVSAGSIAWVPAHRIAELVHRSIPYPLLLLLEQPGTMTLSVGHIRWAQNEAGKVILDGTPYAARIDGSTPAAAVSSLLQALALTRLPRADLFALVQGLIDALTGFRAALLTGQPTTPQTRERAAAQRLALQRCIDLDNQIAQRRGAAVKEMQLPRQVALNLEIKRLSTERAALIASLGH